MKSLPSATGSMCVASATAAPPLLPPADFVRSNALRVTPNTSLKVCEPRPNSGVLVLPTTMQPAAFIRSTISASWSGTWSASSGEPSVLADPFRLRGILDRLRHAVHPAQAFAARERGVARVGLAQQVGLVLQADDRIHLRVDGGDAIERGAHDLAARHLLGVDGARERVGVEVGDRHGRLPVSNENDQREPNII